MHFHLPFHFCELCRVCVCLKEYNKKGLDITKTTGFVYFSLLQYIGLHVNVILRNTQRKHKH